MQVRFILVGAGSYGTLTKVYQANVVYEATEEVWDTLKDETNPGNGMPMFEATDRAPGAIGTDTVEALGDVSDLDTLGLGETDTGASDVALGGGSPDMTVEDLKGTTPAPTKAHAPAPRKLVVGKAGKSHGDDAVIV